MSAFSAASGSDRYATALFVCLHNAGRSQMSAALFEGAAHGRHQALSAGTTPADRVHPEVVQVMNELGIDLSGRTPRRLTRELAEQADVLVTMGCGDECPYIRGKRYLDWDLPDPKSRPLDEIRATRDDIAQRVNALAAQLDTPTNELGKTGAGWKPACNVARMAPIPQDAEPNGTALSGRSRAKRRRRFVDGSSPQPGMPVRRRGSLQAIGVARSCGSEATSGVSGCM